MLFIYYSFHNHFALPNTKKVLCSGHICLEAIKVRRLPNAHNNISEDRKARTISFLFPSNFLQASWSISEERIWRWALHHFPTSSGVMYTLVNKSLKTQLAPICKRGRATSVIISVLYYNLKTLLNKFSSMWAKYIMYSYMGFGSMWE